MDKWVIRKLSEPAAVYDSDPPRVGPLDDNDMIEPDEKNGSSLDQHPTRERQDGPDSINWTMESLSAMWLSIIPPREY
uniref:Uncharacterized protein n=1 Tax=Timema monikensis TaxID=170555 RepID=A0A7R9HRS1_9NEOP|nr:unnamed protein product [Timema monikensis]